MRLKKGNVERESESQVAITKLKSQGYKVISAVKELESIGIVEGASPEALENMTVPELKVLAKEKGIKGAASLNKEELLAVLKDVV